MWRLRVDFLLELKNMKKLSLCVFLSLIWSNFNLVFAERVTWGFSGDSCKNFNETKKKYGKEFDEMFESEIMGFLTGINTFTSYDAGNTDRVKLLDHNSLEYAYNNISEYCRKKPDGHVFIGLIEYYNSLPKAK